jgi:[ribosomal protein S5]-alanine N-acetyltransferase
MAQESPQTHLAIVVDGQAVGGIGVELQRDVFRMSGEIGYWLGQEYWGRGIMSEAVGAMTEHALLSFGINRIFAMVFETNAASARVLERVGYRLEGRLRSAVFKDGRFMDQLVYGYVADRPLPP